MLEALCTRCRETFVPADEDDLEHGVREDGEPCGGRGEITGEWIAPTGERHYSIGIPLAVTVTDDGRVIFDFDLSEVASHKDLDYDGVIDDDVFADDLARIEVACHARQNHHTMTARVVDITEGSTS